MRRVQRSPGGIVSAVCAAGLSTVLVACGGAAVLTSFDAEKSRIRNAVSQGVTCVETVPAPGIERLGCESSAGGFWSELQFVSPGGQRRTLLTIVFKEYNRNDPAAATDFRNILNAYEFTEDDLRKCLEDGGFTKQLAVHRVSCAAHTYSYGRELTVSITQAKAV